MKVLYFDCFSGISGDMFLGSLIDLGVPEDIIRAGIDSLGVEGLTMEFGHANKNGIEARTFKAKAFEQDADTFTGHPKASNHEHDHEHHYDDHHHDHHHNHDRHDEHDHTHAHHDHDHHGRNLGHIRQLILGSAISEGSKKIALDIFQAIAEAEGKIHGAKPEDVHFHEVGAFDSIADIVGAAVAIDWLAPDRIEFSRLPLTKGFVRCNHGLMPLPAPATAELLKEIPIIWEDYRFEMVTPTGAAIAKVLGQKFGMPPNGSLLRTGYGAGKKTYERPNVLRAMLFHGDGKIVDGTPEDIVEIEMNIDDMTGETMGYAMERAMEMGALDAWAQSIYMKKGRPAYKLSFIIQETDLNKFTEFLLKETSTFGFRYVKKHRTVLERGFQTVQIDGGEVRMKVGKKDGIMLKTAPEYEDCKEIARNSGKTLIQVMDQARKKQNSDT